MQHIFYEKNMKSNIKHYIESIHFDITQTGRMMKLVAVQIFNKFGCNIMPDEYIAMDVISCNEGICQRDLAKLILKDRANTGRILNSLESKGLIKRFEDKKGNRLVKKMSLTDAGVKRLNITNKLIEKELETTRKFLSEDEILNLQTSLRQFRCNLEKLLELAI